MHNFFRSRGVEEEEGTCNLRHNADPGSPRQRGSITASREEAVLETTVWEVLVDRTECFRACTKKRNKMWMPQLAQHKHLKIEVKGYITNNIVVFLLLHWENGREDDNTSCWNSIKP